MPIILGIVGQRLAGKDSVAEYIVQKYGGQHVKYSLIMDEVLDILDLPHSRRNEMDISVAMRKVFYDNVWWDAIKKKVTTSTAPIVVINGNRFEDEFKSAQAMGAKMLYVTAPVDVLYQRFVKRSEKTDDNLMSEEQFVNLENEPTEKQIPHLGTLSDFKIENTGTLEELYGKVDEVIAKLKSEQ